MIVAFGNPMLDILIQVDDQLIKKHHLQPNGFARFNESHRKLLEDISDLKTCYKIGGTVTNTVRILKWLAGKQVNVLYCGAIGSDSYGKLIRDKLDEEGIKHIFQEISHVESAKCYVLVNGPYRSLITDIGASKYYDMLVDENRFKKASLMYTSALFRNVPEEKIRAAYEIFLKHNKLIALNLGNQDIFSESFRERMVYMFRYADLVFGNDDEYTAFANLLGLQFGNMEEMLEVFNSKFPEKPNRILVLTRGKDSVYTHQKQIFNEYPLEKIQQNKVVDTTGAGDAFVGGFLSQYIQAKSLGECVKCGIWAAIHIIQRFGCDFDKDLIYEH